MVTMTDEMWDWGLLNGMNNNFLCPVFTTVHLLNVKRKKGGLQIQVYSLLRLVPHLEDFRYYCSLTVSPTGSLTLDCSSLSMLLLQLLE